MSFNVDSELTPSVVKLTTFTPATADEIEKIIKNASKASCQNDPLPSRFLVSVLPSLLTVITFIVNLCLSAGKFPSSLKSAIVKPLLKKPTLDPETLKNFRPVSNLTFLSKIVKK